MRHHYVFVFLVVACTLLATGTSIAQNGTPKREQGPLLWWPIASDLSPTELKAIWDDPSLHRVRYQQAVDEGLREPLSEEQLDRLISFWAGASTPKLLPLWLVFNAYSTHFYNIKPLELERMIREMRGHGFEPETADRVRAAAQEQRAESQRIVLEIREGSRRFVEVQRQTVRAIGSTALRNALDNDDVTTLALATSLSPQSIRGWMKEWKRSPAEEAVEPILRQLKRDLTQEEWDLFRSFLFHHIAPQISTIDFAPVEVVP